MAKKRKAEVDDTEVAKTKVKKVKKVKKSKKKSAEDAADAANADLARTILKTKKKKSKKSPAGETETGVEEPAKKKKKKVLKKKSSKKKKEGADDEDEEKPKKKKKSKKLLKKKSSKKSSKKSTVEKGLAVEEVVEVASSAMNVGNNGYDENDEEEEAGVGYSQEGSKRVFVGNLSFKITEEELKQSFARCGEVANIDWVLDKTTGKFYGSSFVAFTSADAAQKALGMSGQKVMGRPLKVGPATDSSSFGDGANAEGGDKSKKSEWGENEAWSEPAAPATQAQGGAAGRPSKDSSSSAGGGNDGEVVSTRIFLGNLSFRVDDDIIKNNFEKYGEIKSIEWVTDKNTGKFYGSGFVEFDTAEAADKALVMNGEQILGRAMKVGPAKAKTYNVAKGPPREIKPVGKKPKDCTTLFLGNLSFDIDENAVREAFETCGSVKSIRWVERNGQFNGCAFLEFDQTEAVDKAMQKQGEELAGREVRLDYAGANKSY